MSATEINTEIAAESAPDSLLKRPGRREVFFRPRSAPMLAYFDRWTVAQKIWLSLLVFAGLFVWTMHLLPNLRLDRLSKEGVLEMGIAIWLGSEGICFIESFCMWPVARRWRNEHRLAELMLTRLAPHEIAQLMIWRPLRMMLALIMLFGGVLLLTAMIYVPHAEAVLVCAILILNAVVAGYMHHWGAMVIGLGSRHAVTAGLRLIAFAAVYCIWHIPVTVAAAGLMSRNPSGAKLFWLVGPVLMMKYLFARAFARLAAAVMASAEDSTE